ncbi:MAG: HlyC/CorC family transporter [Alphaproteobacteria bacterium]|nr:HlyC/CorC family transporter [Alphaproteobacteria bacterium]
MNEQINEKPVPEPREQNGLPHWLRGLLRSKDDSSLREAIEEYIEETKHDPAGTVGAHERTLIANVLKLRDMAVMDVMIPRAHIVAIPFETSQEDLLALLIEKQFSRFPVYKETLDEIVGTIHIKDVLATLAAGKPLNVRQLMREVQIVSPSMPVIDLMLMMKQQRRHMVLVIDEYGGIDGLVTTGDIVEAIVGEIEDEYDSGDQPQIVENPDGSLTADARVDIDLFEEKYGKILNDDEREDIDTLGGLIFALAGRIPARGEILTHEATGMVFEVLDADPRRVNRVLIRNVPQPE